MRAILIVLLVVSALASMVPFSPAGNFEEAQVTTCVDISLSEGVAVYTYQTCKTAFSYCTPTYAPCMNGIPTIVSP